MTKKETDTKSRQLLEKFNALQNKAAALEEIVRVLLNATSDLAFMIDTEGTILVINDAAAMRLGASQEKLIGTNFYDIYEADEKEFKKAYLQVVEHSRQAVHFEDVYQGNIYSTSIHPVLDQDDEIYMYVFFFNDITELKKNEESIYRYSQIFSTIQDPMSFVDKSYIFRTANNAYLKIYGKSREEVIGRPAEEVFGRDVFQHHIKAPIDRCMEGEKVHYQDWFHLPGGRNRFMYMSFYPLLTKDDKVSGVVINTVDITENRETEEKLQRLYVTDQLTGIYNRVKFFEALNEEVKNILAYDSDLSVIMFDIDHFKKINDTYGHDVGDNVIKHLVSIVKKCIRESDIFARWGGEEFMILLPTADLEIAYTLAERIRERIESRFFEDVGAVTCCFGIAQFLPGDTADTFIKRADKALYVAKKKGRNRVERPKTVMKTSY